MSAAVREAIDRLLKGSRREMLTARPGGTQARPGWWGSMRTASIGPGSAPHSFRIGSSRIGKRMRGDPKTHAPSPAAAGGGQRGARRVSRVISLGAKTRKGGPQKPVPRLV